MCLDGPVRGEVTAASQGSSMSPPPTGFLAGSRALDALDKLITSTESFFHPSNSGPWTLVVSVLRNACIDAHNSMLQLTLFLHRVTAEFSKRWKEEQEQSCRTPIVGVSLSLCEFVNVFMYRHVV